MNLKLWALSLALLISPVLAFANSFSVSLDETNPDAVYGLTDVGIGGGDITLSAWIYLSTQPATDERYIIVQQQDGNSKTSYYTLYNDESSNNYLKCTRETLWVGGVTISYDITLDTETWYNVVCSYNSSNIELFLNGESVAGPTSASGSGSNQGADGFAIGDSDSSSGNIFTLNEITGGDGYGFNGLIDNVIVYNTALTGTDLTNLYDLPCEPTAGWVAMYELEENGNDETGNYNLDQSIGTPSYSSTVFDTCAPPEEEATTTPAYLQESEELMVWCVIIFILSLGMWGRIFRFSS